MKRTLYSTYQSGLLADSDLVRSRPHSRSVRPVFPVEPVIRIDLGDAVAAVDSGWHSWDRKNSGIA